MQMQSVTVFDRPDSKEMLTLKTYILGLEMGLWRQRLPDLMKAVNSVPRKLHMCPQTLSGPIAGGTPALALRPSVPPPQVRNVFGVPEPRNQESFLISTYIV